MLGATQDSDSQLLAVHIEQVVALVGHRQSSGASVPSRKTVYVKRCFHKKWFTTDE